MGGAEIVGVAEVAQDGVEDEGLWEIAGRCGPPQSLRMSELPFVAFLPLTRLAKSVSSEDGAREVLVGLLPQAAACLEAVLALLVPLLAESSCSLRVCSRSIRDERLLIRVMKAWNWERSRRGPRLKLQMIGSTSMARKSESATLPTWRKTLRAAIWLC